MGCDFKYLAFLFSIAILFGSWAAKTPWGFFGHRLINRTAVFTLPVDLIPLYKSQIDYITEHAVDPDKRRHASKLEAIRHYIDIDRWGDDPFKVVPTSLEKAMVKFGTFQLMNNDEVKYSWTGDSIWIVFPDSLKNILASLIAQERIELLENDMLELPSSWMPEGFGELDTNLQLQFREDFSSHGILPYHLRRDFDRLVRNFKERNWPMVLRLSAELGHYVADAHVPLHTTLNYNGQLTGQEGIHAFWESRIPELFATEEYDLFTGRARIIEDTDAFFWQIVKDSHDLVDDVLRIEMELRETFDRDQQYCIEARGSTVMRQPCEAYARAYQEHMQGMVEDRMREAIAAVGSVWYTAWVRAGRPQIEAVEDQLSRSDTLHTIEMGDHELIKAQ